MVTMRQLLSLVLLGGLVGLACWPLNLIDHWQDLLLRQLPAYSSAGWTPAPGPKPGPGAPGGDALAPADAKRSLCPG